MFIVLLLFIVIFDVGFYFFNKQLQGNHVALKEKAVASDKAYQEAIKKANEEIESYKSEKMPAVLEVNKEKNLLISLSSVFLFLFLKINTNSFKGIAKMGRREMDFVGDSCQNIRKT